MNQLHDVVVVGGGPVGSRVAYLLASHGHNVLVLEHKEKPGIPVCCTGIVSRECIKTFDIPENLILNQTSGIRLIPPSGKGFRIPSQKTAAVVIERTALNLYMVKRAQEAGAQYYFGSKVHDIERDTGEVRITADYHGKEQTFKARSVIVACGFNQQLIGTLCLGQIENILMGAQAEVAIDDVADMEVYFNQELAPGFFAWLVPISSSRALAGLALKRNTKKYFANFIDYLASEKKILSPKVNPSFRAIPIGRLSRTYSRRLLVVGDAAGQVKPTSGGGIYYGLICADIAAEKLHRALVLDDLSARNMFGYQREWHRRLGRELRIESYARRLYEGLSNRQIDRLFEIAQSNGIVRALFESDEDLPFDRHGEIILKLLKYKSFSGMVRAIPVLAGFD